MSKQPTLRLRDTAVDPLPSRPLPAVIEITIPDKFSDVGKFEAAVTEQWSRVENATLHLGRLLNVGRDSFPHGDFEAALGRISTQVGASPRVLRQAMRLAVGIAALPGDARAWERVPSLADEALTAQRQLPPAIWEQGVQDGVIAPTSTVQTLRAFVRSARACDGARQQNDWTPESLAREIARLENVEIELQRRLDTTRQRLQALRANRTD